MNELYMAAVISAWSCSPVFRRAAVDKMGEGSEATFVLLNTLFCSVIALAVAYPTKQHFEKYVHRVDLITVFFIACSAAMALGAGYFLTKLIATDNPGLVMAVLNGCTNVISYTVATLFYGNFTARGVLGALLISAGIYTIKSS